MSEEDKLIDVENPHQGESWFYSDIVKDHFFQPRNFLKNRPADNEFDGRGEVGSAACGDILHVWIKVDKKTKKIKEFKWQTFGCSSAIASTSIISEMVTENGGMLLEEAEKIKPQEIIDRLGGLPTRKIHCSVLGDRALREAIKDYYQRQENNDKIIKE